MFSWDAATLKERADWIRRHRKTLCREQVRDLFKLTDEGIDAIYNGADWREDLQKPEEQ